MTLGELAWCLAGAFVMGFALTNGELGWCLLGAFVAGLGVAELVMCFFERRKATRWRAAGRGGSLGHD